MLQSGQSSGQLPKVSSPVQHPSPQTGLQSAVQPGEQNSCPQMHALSPPLQHPSPQTGSQTKLGQSTAVWSAQRQSQLSVQQNGSCPHTEAQQPESPQPGVPLPTQQSPTPGEPGEHSPSSHVSLKVQGLPSSHGAVLNGCRQAPVPSQTSSVHSLPSSAQPAPSSPKQSLLTSSQVSAHSEPPAQGLPA